MDNNKDRTGARTKYFLQEQVELDWKMNVVRVINSTQPSLAHTSLRYQDYLFQPTRADYLLCHGTSDIPCFFHPLIVFLVTFSLLNFLHLLLRSFLYASDCAVGCASIVPPYTLPFFPLCIAFANSPSAPAFPGNFGVAFQTLHLSVPGKPNIRVPTSPLDLLFSSCVISVAVQSSPPSPKTRV